MSNEDVVLVEPSPEVVAVYVTDTEVVQVSTGEIGPPGPPGAAGSGYPIAQPTPAGTWILNHPLNRLPSVTVYDTTGQEVVPDVYVTSTTVTLVFATPTAGTAVLT